MTRKLALIVFCGLFAAVFSDDDATDCIFDWQTFYPQSNNEGIIIDYSEQKITTLEEGDMTYHYIVGPFIAKEEVGDSYEVLVTIDKFTDGEASSVLVKYLPVCDFVENVYPSYLLPIEGKHNDFPSDAYDCPIKEGTTNIYEAENSEQLKAPSVLENGEYSLFLSFLKDYRTIGGLAGNFTVLRN